MVRRLVGNLYGGVPGNMTAYLLVAVAAAAVLGSVAAGGAGGGGTKELDPLSQEFYKPHYGPYEALPFMFTSVIIGCIIQQFASLTVIPFTGLIFITGLLLGLLYEGAGQRQNFIMKDNALGTLGHSIEMWIEIEPHLLLYGFLPPLLFGDASVLNLHVVKRCFMQCLLLAGPGVLLGSFLTAILFKYGPLEWEWYPSMMIGAVLSATDPVAVVGLLKSMGASPKLTMIIAGESLLNDGVSIVIFNLFLNMYKSCSWDTLAALQNKGVNLGYYTRQLVEKLTVNLNDDVPYISKQNQYVLDEYCATHGLCEVCKAGKEYSAGGIVEFFARMAVGGPVVGALMGFGLVLFIAMTETAVGQIAMSLAAAYCSYFVAEHDALMSGVLACVSCSVVFAAYGWPSVASPTAMTNFWHACEFICNVMIFMLSGVLTGHFLYRLEPYGLQYSDFGYLIILYILLTLIRYAVILLFYPALSNMGLGITMKEVLVVGWGGLRGAVGLALAIAITETKGFKGQVQAQFFFFTAGIATMTLLINGTTCGWLLKKLKLVGLTESEKALEEDAIRLARNFFEDEYAKYSKSPRFAYHDPGVVRKFFAYLLEDKSAEEMKGLKRSFSQWNKSNRGPGHNWSAIKNIAKVLPDAKLTVDIPSDLEPTDLERSGAPKVIHDVYPSSEALAASQVVQAFTLSSHRHPTDYRPDGKGTSSSSNGQVGQGHMFMNSELDTEEIMTEADPEMLKTVREVFLNAVRARYWDLLQDGALRDSWFTTYLLQSIDEALDRVSHDGSGLCDWEIAERKCITIKYKFLADIAAGMFSFVQRFGLFSFTKPYSRNHAWHEAVRLILVHPTPRVAVTICYAFLYAHEYAGIEVWSAVGDGDNADSPEEQIVLRESLRQMEAVKEKLRDFEKNFPGIITSVMSDSMCCVLQARLKKRYDRLLTKGSITGPTHHHLLALIGCASDH